MDISQALGRDIPFATHLGIQLTEKSPGRVVLMLEIRPQLMNRFEVAHGGVVMTLLDIAMAIATNTLDESAEGVITVEMKANFMGAAKGTVTVEGRCLHLGKTLAFCEGNAHDGAGKLCATASGTFMVRHAGGRKPGAAPAADA